MGEHADHDRQSDDETRGHVRRPEAGPRDARAPDAGAPATLARRAKRIGVTAHLVIPTCLSGLLLVVFFPLILRLQPDGYEGATGRSPDRYLIVWLLFTAALFLASALIWAVRTTRRR